MVILLIIQIIVLIIIVIVLIVFFKYDVDISFSDLVNNYNDLKTNILFNSQPLTITSNLIYKDIYIVNNNSIIGKTVLYIFMSYITNSNNSGRPIFTIMMVPSILILKMIILIMGTI